MNEEEKRKEIARLLLFVYQEYSKEITSGLINLWLDALRGHRLSDAQLAAKLLLQTKNYGEPKLGDFMEALKKVEATTRKPKYNPRISERDRERIGCENIVRKLINNVKEIGHDSKGTRSLPEPELQGVRRDRSVSQRDVRCAGTIPCPSQGRAEPSDC